LNPVPAAELIETNGDLYLKAFLLDTSTNVNGWGVNNATIDQNIKTFIGKPFVLQDDFAHPMSNDTYDHHLQYQEGFRIGNIAQIVSKDGIYSALIKVTDKIASNGFKAGELPLYVSPQIYHYDVGKEPDDNASGWKGTHLAVVDQPAYGVQKARIISQCQGEEGVCMAQLANAKLKETKCNCVKQAITNFKSIVANNKVKAGSSLENKTHIKYVADDNANDKNSQDAATLQAEIEKLKEEKKTLEAALSEKDTVVAGLKASNDDILKQVKEIKTGNRTEKIANILSGVKFDREEDRKTKLDTLVGSNLEISFIEETYKPLREANANATKSGSVESKLELKDASAEESDPGVPNWVMTFRHSGGSF
jgi:hypothetical protein